MSIRYTSVLLIFISLAILFGCADNVQDAPVPSYIQVDGFSFQGEGPDSTGYPTQRISDVWIYVNNQIIGVYAIPTGKIPVLAEGKSRISLQAGVYTDGIRKSRVYYPFYKDYLKDTLLEKEKTLILRPKFGFAPKWKGRILKKPFSFFQDFESGDSGCIKGETGTIEPIRAVHENSSLENMYGRRYLKLTTQTDGDVLDVSNDVYLQLQTNGDPVYLEFDYKSTCPVQVGVRGKVGITATGIVQDLILNPNSEWTKIYVSLSEETGLFQSEAVSQKKPAFFRFFLRSIGAPGAGNSLSIDNVRLLN